MVGRVDMMRFDSDESRKSSGQFLTDFADGKRHFVWPLDVLRTLSYKMYLHLGTHIHITVTKSMDTLALNKTS